MRPVDSLKLPDEGRGPGRALLALGLMALLTVAAPAFGEGPGNASGDSGRVRTPSGVYFNIEVQDQTVSLEAINFPLVEILEQLAEDLSFQLQVIGELNGRVTWSAENHSPDEIIEKLLDRRSYTVVYAMPKAAPGKAAIGKLYVIGDAGRRQADSYESQAQIHLRQQQWKDREVRVDRMKQMAREQTAGASWELAVHLSGDPDFRIRYAAAMALGEYSDPASVETLRIALQDSSHWVRQEALRSLAKIGNPESLEDVKFVIDTDPDERVRELAARVLNVLERKVQQ